LVHASHGAREPIGFSARLTQNDGFTDSYKNQQNNCEGWTHIAVMGDPTLRMQIVAPASDVVVSAAARDADVTWTPSSESVAGYNVYRAANPSGPFTRINSSLVKATSFAHANAVSAIIYILVRAVRLEKSASGTYFNPSQGVFASLGSSVPVNVAKAAVPAPKPAATAKPPAEITALGRELPPTGTANVDTIWFDDSLPCRRRPG